MAKALNIAHRGYTKDFPGNTLEAFNAAIKLGVQGIECDVHETSDSKFIIYHDDDIEGRPISEIPLKEIQKIKLKGQFKIPTLEETMDTCREKVMVNLEIKLVYSIDKFLKIVRAAARPDALLLSSFQGSLITELSDAAPEIPRGIITGFKVKDPVTTVKLTRAQVMLPRFSFTTMALVDKMHIRSLKLIVWDCNTPEDIRSALAWDVDGIITDSPDVLSSELSQIK
jgi:glycerophosphoryl diester phosphodiesterase